MVSYSDTLSIQRCPRQWYYGSKLQLTSKNRKHALDVGTWMHLLLGEHYRGNDWKPLHAQLTRDYVDKYPTDEAVADSRLVESLMERYVKRYADTDAIWEVVAVEETFTVGDFSFTPDLIVKGAQGLWVVDHKTTGNAFGDTAKMIDPQKLAYVEGLQMLGMEVRGFIFNWIKRALPTQPRLKKDGGIAYLNTLATDYETLRDFAAEHRLSYPELSERLATLKVSDNFFMRQPILTPTTVGYIENLRPAMKLAQEGDGIDDYPMHVNVWPGPLSCHNCQFANLCFSEIRGIPYADALLEYEKRPEKGSLT